MVEKEDQLGLSLSLSYPVTETVNRSYNDDNNNNNSNKNYHMQLNLMPVFLSTPPAAHQSPSPLNFLQKTPMTNSLFPSSDRNTESAFRAEPRPMMRGIDVNRLPVMAAETEDELGVSSPNSTVSSISGKRTEREVTANCEEQDMDRDSSRGTNNSEDEDGENSRKKLRLSKDQSAVLEESFKEHNTLNPKQKQALAKRLGLRPRQVEVWFQNRRARTKLKQTEVDCEFLKRCCENLTEENRRLQKEVQELRALKLSPQFYMQMTPPTTLTMCPSCERVAISPAVAAPIKTEPRPSPVAANHQRAIPFNPWAAIPVQRAYDFLHPRS